MKKLNKKGVSLTEILVSLGLLGILSGIATVSYHSYTVSANKKALLNSGRLFLSAVNDCVAGAGGWQIWRFKKTGETCDTGRTVDPCKKAYPCKAKQADNSTPIEDVTEVDISSHSQKKINWTCPAILKLDDGDECKVFSRNETAVASRFKYYCLSLFKADEKLQVIARFSKDRRFPDHIYCGKVTTAVNLEGKTCKKNPDPALSELTTPCPWAK